MTVRRELTRAERDLLDEPPRRARDDEPNGSARLMKPEGLFRDRRAPFIVPDGHRFVSVEGTVRANDAHAVAQADIRELARRYYGSDDRVQRGANATWAKRRRITYRLPVRRVHRVGF